MFAVWHRPTKFSSNDGETMNSAPTPIARSACCRRQDRSSTDMNTAAPGQFFDHIQRARHAESNLDELDTAIGSGIGESECILWACRAHDGD